MLLTLILNGLYNATNKISEELTGGNNEQNNSIITSIIWMLLFTSSIFMTYLAYMRNRHETTLLIILICAFAFCFTWIYALYYLIYYIMPFYLSNVDNYEDLKIDKQKKLI